jgi:pimeloyl-ACP methyl ester carboxylesterase
VARPAIASEASVVPNGAGDDRQAQAAADVFFVHGTGYTNAREWNSAFAPDDGAPEHAHAMIAWQASAFNQCCRIFAPHYREANLAAFIDHGPNGAQAIDVAYQDVERAFDDYIARDNKGRPFILAGHSQGAVHALQLLERKIDGTPLVQRMVAAYLPGVPIPLKKLAQFRSIKICQNSTDTRCLVSWNTYREGGRPDASLEVLWTWYHSAWVSSLGQPVLCTNPLSWTVDETPVSAEKNLASIHPHSPGALWRLLTGRPAGTRYDQPLPWREHQTGAVCRDGFLRVPNQGHDYVAPFEGSYHTHDIALFYGNLRQNAIDRVHAFVAP